AYAPVRENGFVRFDDPIYITENPQVVAGLTAEGFAWAFTTGNAANWHPLTWLSHMADCELFGLDAAAHHRTSVLLHAASAVILFFWLAGITRATWKGLFVAGVFALHPLHVESVAWAAERKDVLSTLLGLLSLAAWTSWTTRGGHARYALSLALFALGLLAKPMLVSLPLLLVLLDLWPLERATIRELPQRLREKIPFFLLAALSAVITFVAQKSGGAMERLPDIPLALRAANALVSYASYLLQALWPTRLGVFYPYPLDGIPFWKVGAAGAFVWIATVLAVRAGIRRPWIAVGWLWYVVTLLPVIGLVQVGRQAMADRYTYLPLVGPSILAALGAAELTARWKLGGALRTIAGGAVLAGCVLLTRAQVHTWKDDVSLFGRACAVTGPNFLAQYALAGALHRAGRIEESIAAYRVGLAIHADFTDQRNAFGELLESQGDLDGAIEQYRASVRIDPTLADAHALLAGALAKQGLLDEAAQELALAAEIDPASALTLRAAAGLERARAAR
ncbi:MAG: tetratricopeptide repeat protein, partial [Planctomycetota bacterium]